MIKEGRGPAGMVELIIMWPSMPTHKKCEHLLVDRYSNPSKEVSYLCERRDLLIRFIVNQLVLLLIASLCSENHVGV